MEYLYVCSFSNGHIKVGRSNNPESRISQHVDRVSCLGIKLIDKFIVECVGLSAPSETALINRCVDTAEKRNKSEWFEGLSFDDVCAWALDASKHQPKEEETHISKQAVVRNAEYPSKWWAINLFGGKPSTAASAIGYKSPHAIYMWPEMLPPSIIDRVLGASARFKEATKRRKRNTKTA